MEKLIAKKAVHDEAAANASQGTVTTAESGNRMPLTRYVTLLFAIACGMSVANIYFAQPLLDELSNEFNMDYSIIGILITVTQIFYALGLLLLVPLGDLLNQRRLIIAQMAISMAALVIVGTASSGTVLFAGLALVGLLAVVTQTIVAFVATIAAPAERGRAVGMVTSGIVIGSCLLEPFQEF